MRLLTIVTILILGLTCFASEMITEVADDIYQVFDTNSGTSKICTVIGTPPTQTVVCR